MRQDNNTIRELYAQYRKPNMTRAERQEMREKIYRERYKYDKRKPITQKGQALVNMISGLLIVLMFPAGLFGNKLLGKNITNIFFVSALAIAFGLMIYDASHKREPADELAKELMVKATAYSAYAQIVIVYLVGLVITMVNNSRGVEYIKVTSDHVGMLAMLLLGIYLVVRNGAYLWLDRTPKSDDEEE